MNAQLVKLDVAAASLGWSAAKLFDLTDGGTLLEKGFAWVFNLANDPADGRRDLRFWFPEILARADADTSRHGKYSNWEIDWVVAKILPAKRRNFHAGEVDQIFQIRHNTRRALLDSAGMSEGRNFYSRAMLAEFLTARWLGAVWSRKKEEGGMTNLSACATGANKPDTNKQSIHAPTSSSPVPSYPAPASEKRNGSKPSTVPAALSGAAISSGARAARPRVTAENKNAGEPPALLAK